MIHTYLIILRFCHTKKRGHQLATPLLSKTKLQLNKVNFYKYYSTTRISVLRLAACSSSVHGTPSAHLLTSCVSPYAFALTRETMIPFAPRSSITDLPS